ncbi:MAG: ribosome-associated translation inhibitor RaiA [Candidatus Margulisiibacteriota bacterium]
MQINYKGHGLEMTDALKDYAVKKLQKIEHFFHNVQQIDIELEFSKIREAAKNQIAKVTVWASGTKLHAIEETGDMYASIDLVVDKIDHQIKKFKEKLVHEKRRESSKEKHHIIENLDREQPAE